MMHATELLGHRYALISLLGQGAMGAVYLACDRLTQQMVALKRVEVPAANVGTTATANFASMAATMAATSAIQVGAGSDLSDAIGSGATEEALRLYHLALAHEFRTMSSLRHPHIVSVLDYGFYEGQPYFTMELLTGCQSLREAAAHRTIEQKTWLLAQVLLALVYLHRRGVLHRDLKPSNVMCIGEHVKVVDFGVATTVGYDRSIAGTVEYMAPEILLGKNATPASDLYSFGVMACELLSGLYPFARHSATQFLSNVLGLEKLLAVNQQWLSILEVLCQHLPTSRNDAAAEDTPPLQEEALAQIQPPALSEFVRRLLARNPAERFASAEAALRALGAATGTSYDAALAGTRESFLQAARLVGRDQELEQLEAALDKTINGQGGIWLVGGESGVGKSRLLDELRALALVRGIQVVRGQAQSSGEAAYREWGEVLRTLCLSTEISELEASVLKSLVADLGQLLGRPLGDAAVLDPLATQQRLINTVLDVLSRQNIPTLVILEDIHWSSSESVALLRRLGPLLANQRLLVLASYRHDERSDLPSEISGSQALMLGRLQKNEVAELSLSMLGATNFNQALVEFLEKESEGNTFFMIEVLRALVEEAGSLEAVGRAGVPAALKVGGVQAVLKRRLLRVPETWRETLLLMAVAGRQIDPVLLHSLQPQADEFLAACANAAVLEINDQQWRFSHDKIREAALASLSSAQRQAMHGQVAAGLQRGYADPSPHAVLLAYHYQQAGQLEQGAHYAAIAGEQAMRAGAMREAEKQLQQALSYYDEVNAPALLRARLHRLLADSYHVLGQYSEVIKSGQIAQELLGMPFPKRSAQISRALALHALEFLASLYGYLPQRPCDPKQEAVLREFTELGWAFCHALVRLSRGKETLLMTLRVQRAARSIKSCDGQLMALSMIAIGMRLFGRRDIGQRCLQTAERLLPNSGTKNRGSFMAAKTTFHMLEGRLRQGAAEAEALLRWSSEQGDIASECLAIRAQIPGTLALGNLAEGEAKIAELKRLAQRSETSLYAAVAHVYEGISALYRNDLEKARECGNAVLFGAKQVGEKLTVIMAQGLLGLVALHCGQNEEALAVASELLSAFADDFTNTLAGPDCAPVPAEIFLTLWRNRHVENSALRKKAIRAVMRLQRHQGIMPRSRPRFLLWDAVLAGLRGDGRRQRACLEESLKIARCYALPMDEGFACLELGRALLAKDPAGHFHLRRAVHIFDQAGATFFLQKAEALLNPR